ncbi:MAG: hypothetical protein J0L84_14375 [Verrucomicrobia bacterium]|nr:hypothetical protein [Verrucomicrobiota bacterium]
MNLTRTLPLFLAVSTLQSFAAENPPPAGELRIHTAIEVEFGTERGTVYQLQGSSNLVDWTAIGDPVFGSGRSVSQVHSTRKGMDVVFQSYRLDIAAAPTNGLAPWSLAGMTLSLDDQPGDDQVRFDTDTEGHELGDSPDPFRYVFQRTGPDTVTADLQRDADRHDLLTLTFTAEGQGTWVREEYRKGRLKDRDLGVFTVLATDGAGTGGTPGGDPENPGGPVTLPAGLAGTVYSFESGCGPVRLEFTSGATGIEHGDDVNDDEPNVFLYTFTLTGTNTTSLVITFKPGRSDEYELTFGSDLQGRFVRRELRDGSVKDVDRGTFGASGPGTAGGTGGTGGTVQVPEGPLTGLTYVMSDGETPDRLVFETDTRGTEYSDDPSTKS